MLAVIGKGTGLRPGATDEVKRFPELLARGRGGYVVVESLRTRARGEARHHTTIAHIVEHRIFFRHAQRIGVQRQQIAKHHDPTFCGRMGERGGDDVRRGHQPIDVLVMLVQHHAVEADLRGIDQLVDVFAQQSARFLLVPE